MNDNLRFLGTLAQQIANDERARDRHLEYLTQRYGALKTKAEEDQSTYGHYLSVMLNNDTLLISVDAQNIHPTKRYSIFVRALPGAEGFECGAHGSNDFSLPQATPDLSNVDEWLARAISKAVCRARADEDAAAKDAAAAERAAKLA